MTDKTKITLSGKELQLVCNTDWILTKHIIIKKVIALFGEILVKMQEATEQDKAHLPKEIFMKAPKISRGENYKNLPYVMLDYPRYFDKENTLAVRTLFWWGNFFSINFQVSGTVKKLVLNSLANNFLRLQQQQYWLCVSNTPWQHTFEEDNYITMQSLTSTQFEALLTEKSFVKIGKKISLQQWDGVSQFAEQSFIEMMDLLKINYPNDEKDLSPGIPITGSGL